MKMDWKPLSHVRKADNNDGLETISRDNSINFKFSILSNPSLEEVYFCLKIKDADRKGTVCCFWSIFVKCML